MYRPRTIIARAAMILVVDTYNVLHVVGVLPPELAGVDVAELANLIQGSRYGSTNVELICDGTPAEHHQIDHESSIRLRYAGPGHEADDLIAGLIQKSTSPKRLTVVSSDQWVIRQARRRRCRTMSSEIFLQRLVQDALSPNKNRSHRPANPLSKGEIAKWLDVFRIAPNERQSSTAPEQMPSESGSDNSTLPTSPTRKREKQRGAARDGLPLPQDIVEQAERIWAENRNDDI